MADPREQTNAQQGLRKPELITRLVEVVSDARAMAEVVRRLPKPSQSRLDQLRRDYGQYYPGYVAQGTPSVSADRVLPLLVWWCG